MTKDSKPTVLFAVMSPSEPINAGFTQPGSLTSFVDAMAEFATGVTVVCVRDPDDDGDVGMTATSFASVALSPPMISIGVVETSYTHEVLSRASRWSVTVLSAHQRALAGRFGVAGRPSPRLLLAGEPHHRGAMSGALVIDEGLTALECETEQRIVAGDHTVLIARVLDIAYVNSKKEPLLRFRRGYSAL